MRLPSCDLSHLLVLLAFSMTGAVSGDVAAMEVLDFSDPGQVEWQVVNDGVMGGRSSGGYEISDGALRFSGNLVTRGGGFASVRTRVELDLSAHEGLELRVRSNGRSFELEVNDGQRQGWRTVSHRAPLATDEKWRTVRVPFSALRATVFGRRVVAPAVELSRVERLGFYILDGRNGPFLLEVDSVRAYKTP